MWFKCCLTLSLLGLWMLHDWWHEATVLSFRSYNKTTALFLSLLACIYPSLFGQYMWCAVPHVSIPLPNIQQGMLQPRCWQIEIGMADHMVQLAHILCALSRRTLTSWAEAELVQWLCQCHLMFCLAVSVECRYSCCYWPSSLECSKVEAAEWVTSHLKLPL